MATSMGMRFNGHETMTVTGFEVYTVATADPDILTFVANRIINPTKPRAYYSVDEADDEASRAFFEITGVTGFFILNDFVTAHKDAAASWGELIPPVEAAMRTHYAPRKKMPAVKDAGAEN